MKHSLSTHLIHHTVGTGTYIYRINFMVWLMNELRCQKTIKVNGVAMPLHVLYVFTKGSLM